MKKYLIKLNGKEYVVEMEELTGDAAPTAASDKAKTAETQVPVQNSEGQTVEAPMPGNILEVSVKAGDQVKKGQVLFILEAMKMENEIVSPADGRIISVSVIKGQAVKAGEPLVQIS